MHGVGLNGHIEVREHMESLHAIGLNCNIKMRFEKADMALTLDCNIELLLERAHAEMELIEMELILELTDSQCYQFVWREELREIKLASQEDLERSLPS